MLHLKEESVGICLKIICPGFYEEPILHLPLEYDHVQVDWLAELSKHIDSIVGTGKIIFFCGWRSQVIIPKGTDHKLIFLLKAVEVGPGKRQYVRYNYYVLRICSAYNLI